MQNLLSTNEPFKSLDHWYHNGKVHRGHGTAQTLKYSCLQSEDLHVKKSSFYLNFCIHDRRHINIAPPKEFTKIYNFFSNLMWATSPTNKIRKNPCKYVKLEKIQFAIKTNDLDL